MSFFKGWLEQADGPLFGGLQLPKGKAAQPQRLPTHQGQPMPAAGLPGLPDTEFFYELQRSPDPIGFIIDQHRNPAISHSLMTGFAYDSFQMTDQHTSMLVLGPPRSGGKSSGLVIPNILTHRGPCASISTKSDNFVATSFARRRQGEVWSFSPDGSKPLPGSRQLRWSPISDDWGGCLHRSEWMVKASGQTESGGRENNTFWIARAGDLLAVVLFYAGITGKPMRWLINVIDGQRLKDDFLPMVEDLEQRGHTTPASMLHGIIYTGDKTRSDIFGTASVVLKPYRLPGALKTTEDPNFDVMRFVVGDPEAPNLLLRHHPMNNLAVRNGTTQPRNWRNNLYQLGHYDTVYIVVSEENMQACAPLIVGFLGDVQRQVYAQHREDETSGRAERRVPVLWAIDELASCPVPLPTILRDAGSQGLLILGALQDLQQTTAKWGEEGKSLPTLFGNVVVTPGIRDVPTLENLSKLVGQFEQEVWGGSWSGGNKSEWNPSVSFQRIPRLDVSDLYRGNPMDPDAALIFQRNGWSWTQLQHYFRRHPWPVMYLRDIGLFLTGQPDLIYEGLPFPQLIRNGDYSNLSAISPNLPRLIHSQYETYEHLKARWRDLLERQHAEALAENERRATELTPAEAASESNNVVPLTRGDK